MLEFCGVRKQFPDGTVAISGVDLVVAPGELVSVVGPSGCGKSTILRIASGLMRPSAGVVSMATDRIGHVFQDPTLLPWRTVQANVELLTELHGLPRDERRSSTAFSILNSGMP
jgi:NitT/TauT family transport system ATP-binding protein